MSKKILIIHDYPHCEGGGIEVQGFIDGKELVKRGYSVTIASTRQNSETYTGKFISQKDGVDFAVIKSKSELEKLISQYDVVQIMATFSLREGTMNALEILNAKKRPHVISVHTNIGHINFGALSEKTKFEKKALLSKFASFLSSPHSTIVGGSESLKGSLDVLGVNKKHIVIHNAKNWETFLPTKDAGKIKMADITYTGEISCMKGVHTLLSSIVILKKSLPKISVRIIGSGTSEKECLSLVEALGLQENVECVGHVESRKIPDYLVRTKILTLPSLTESWGNIVMEAMGLGTTTVSSRVEGLIELTENGQNGFLCNPGDPEDFAKTFLGILDGTLHLPRTETEILEKITQKYRIEKRVSELEKILLK